MRFVLRIVLVMTVLLMVLGYAGSQIAYFSGNAMDWAQKVDTKPIQTLSLVLFVILIVGVFITPTRGPEESE